MPPLNFSYPIGSPVQPTQSALNNYSNAVAAAGGGGGVGRVIGGNGAGYTNYGQNYTNYGQNYTNYGQQALWAAGIGSPPGAQGPAAPPPGATAVGRLGAAAPTVVAGGGGGVANPGGAVARLGGAAAAPQAGNSYGLTGQYADLLGLLDGYGQAQLGQINDRYAGLQGSAIQNAVSRGFAGLSNNTPMPDVASRIAAGNYGTVPASLQRGLNIDQNKALQAATEGFNKDKASLAASLLGQQTSAGQYQQDLALRQQQLAQQQQQFEAGQALQREQFLRSSVSSGGAGSSGGGGSGRSNFPSNPSQSSGFGLLPNNSYGSQSNGSYGLYGDPYSYYRNNGTGATGSGTYYPTGGGYGPEWLTPGVGEYYGGYLGE